MAVSLNGVESYHVDRDGANQELAGCSFDFRKTKVATKFRFTYVKDVFSELAIHYEEWDSWETCFKLGNLTVPDNPYVGFSAATGDVSDNHEIVSVSTNNIVYKKRSRKELEEAKRYHLGDPKIKTKSKGASFWSSSSSKDAGGHSYNGNAGGNIFKRFFGSLFSFAWTLFKWGAAIALVGAAGYAYYMRKKKFDVSDSRDREQGTKLTDFILSRQNDSEIEHNSQTHMPVSVSKSSIFISLHKISLLCLSKALCLFESSLSDCKGLV